MMESAGNDVYLRCRDQERVAGMRSFGVIGARRTQRDEKEPTFVEMKHIDHIGIIVANEERSTTFYRDVLKCTVIERTTTASGTALVFLRAGSSQDAALIEFIIPPSGAQPVAPVPEGTAGIRHICFHVDNLDEWHEHLKQHNVPITTAPRSMPLPSGNVRLMFCTDPDGVSLEFYEREHEV